MKFECKVSVFCWISEGGFRLFPADFADERRCTDIPYPEGSKNCIANFTFVHFPGLLCRTSAQTCLRTRTAIKTGLPCDKKEKENAMYKEMEKRTRIMKGNKGWGAFALIAGAAMLLSSCVVHRHPRPHRHRPHRHRVVVIAEQAAATGSSRDCVTFGACLAAVGPDGYGSTE